MERASVRCSKSASQVRALSRCGPPNGWNILESLPQNATFETQKRVEGAIPRLQVHQGGASAGRADERCSGAWQATLHARWQDWAIPESLRVLP